MAASDANQQVPYRVIQLEWEAKKGHVNEPGRPLLTLAPHVGDLNNLCNCKNMLAATEATKATSWAELAPHENMRGAPRTTCIFGRKLSLLHG